MGVGKERSGSQGEQDGQDERVRVGIDVTPLLGRRTGIGRFAEGLVDGLHARRATSGIDVVPFAMTARGHRLVAPDQRLALPARPARMIWERMDHPRLERFAGALDVVHGTNYVVPPSRGRRLASVHDLTALRFPEMCTPDVRRMPVLLRRQVAAGAHVHTDSRHVAEEVCDVLGVRPERVHTIAPGIPVDAVRIERARSAPPLYDGRPFLLALGTVEPRKSLPSLVRAFADVAARAPDVVLVVAGADGWGSGDLDDAIAGLPTATRARVVRERDVDDDFRDRLLVKCRVFVYPSRYEGFGFPPLEAMCAGRPVVSTTAGSLPEVLGDAALLVAPDDADALAEAMWRVLDDDALASELVRRGHERTTRYSWDAMADGFVQLYREMAGR